MLMTGNNRWVRLIRARSGMGWIHNVIYRDLHLAWRGTARMVAEERESNPRFEAVVVREEDWRAGRLLPVKPPAGFDLALTQGTAVADDAGSGAAAEPGFDPGF
jgi:hypothetical protein